MTLLAERGFDVSGFTPDLMTSADDVFWFPNLVGPIYPGSALLFRVRPNGRDPHSAIKDTWVLEWPRPGEPWQMPRAPVLRRLARAQLGRDHRAGLHEPRQRAARHALTRLRGLPAGVEAGKQRAAHAPCRGSLSDGLDATDGLRAVAIIFVLAGCSGSSKAGPVRSNSQRRARRTRSRPSDAVLQLRDLPDGYTELHEVRCVAPIERPGEAALAGLAPPRDPLRGTASARPSRCSRLRSAKRARSLATSSASRRRYASSRSGRHHIVVGALPVLALQHALEHLLRRGRRQARARSARTAASTSATGRIGRRGTTTKPSGVEASRRRGGAGRPSPRRRLRVTARRRRPRARRRGGGR